MIKLIHRNHQIKSVIWKQREWFSCTASSLFDLLFTSEHLEQHAAIQDFSSRFGTFDRIVNCLIAQFPNCHCCIVREMYYLHVFLSLSVFARSRGAFLCAHSHIQSVCCEYQMEFGIKQAKLKWPNIHRMSSKWSFLSILISTVGFVINHTKYSLFIISRTKHDMLA